MAKQASTLGIRERRVVAPLPAAKSAALVTTESPGGLRILRDTLPAVEIVLQPDGRYLLGRHEAADLGFDSDEVSRLHGLLSHADGRWSYEDLGSRNGSCLLRGAARRELEARQPVALAVGDTLELGTAEARVELLVRPLSVASSDGGTIRSAAAQRFEELLAVAARTHVPVFLLGPSGCGKTHSARRIHELGEEPGPFVPINCARLPSDTSALHSELLGHVRGAFTGAESDRTGKLVHADGGTLFLDEVESLSALAQGFLLDVLEGSGDLAPLGSRQPHLRAPLFRLISASKVPLARSGLRDDLCERLAEGHLWQVPTLDDRREDIPALLQGFADEQGKLLGIPVELEAGAVELACAAAWPGQIRQLKAAVRVLAQMQMAQPGDAPTQVCVRAEQLARHLRERAQAFGEPGVEIALSEQPGPTSPAQKADPRRLTREQLAALLAQHDSNRSEVARQLGIARNTLARKLREFGLG